MQLPARLAQILSAGDVEELPCDCKVSAGAEWLRVNFHFVVLCLAFPLAFTIVTT